MRIGDGVAFLGLFFYSTLHENRKMPEMLHKVFDHPIEYYIVFIHIVYGIGILTAVHALFKGRTAQGSVAWIIALISMPFVAIPLYLVFGRNKFFGYIELLRSKGLKSKFSIKNFIDGINRYKSEFEESILDYKVFENLVEMPFTFGNQAKLLVNGNDTFDSIIESINTAENYVLFQFYIVKNDGLGNRLKDALIKKADEGVNIYFLYDEIGSGKLTKKYVQELRDHSNVEIHRFKTTRGPRNRFQLNFRNHRKIVVIDGKTAFVGGHNVGDEYLGLDAEIGPWRDTHCRICGPVVMEVQVIFLADWYWASRNIPTLNWRPEVIHEEEVIALALPTGPADVLESGTLYFTQAIQMAQKRLWIASPYFVPDSSIVDALQLAALRGVDVKIIIPQNPDTYLPYLAAYSFLPEVEASGIEIYRYKEGFMHQKVILVDDHLASVGTANFDNRSMRLNFEISLLIRNRGFASEVEEMLKADLEKSRLCHVEDYENRSFWFKMTVKFFRLLAPIL